MQGILLYIPVVLLILGALGALWPLLPGIPLMAGAIIVHGLMTGFADYAAVPVMGLVILIFMGIAVDYVAGAIGARQAGSSRAGIWGAVLGLVVGLLALGPIGLLLGPFLGALLGELVGGADLDGALRASLGVAVGFLGAAVVKFTLAVLVLILFFLYLW